MKTIWILVVDASRAFFYVFSKKDLDFPLIKHIDHPQSRLKDTALIADKPGHYQKGTYEPHTHAHALEIERFIKQLCQELEQGRVSYAYTAVAIVAEPRVYGLIYQLASQQVQKMIRLHLAKDYAHLSEQNLRIKIRQNLVNDLKRLLS